MTAPLTIDNRDKDEIIAMLEARIEVLSRRVKELESRSAAVEAYTFPEADPEPDWAVPC